MIDRRGPLNLDLELIVVDADARTFGTTNEAKRAYIRHGFKLAVEEMRLLLASQDDHASPHDAT
jgi:hypothetical protein